MYIANNTFAEEELMPEVCQDDNTLVSDGLEGNRDALDILFSRYHGVLYSFAHRMLGNREEAEDAVQNAFLLAFCKLSQLKDQGAFRSWLTRIVMNEATSILRKRKRALLRSPKWVNDTDDETVENISFTGLDPEEAVVKKEWITSLNRELARLSPTSRTTVQLCEIEEYTTEEASSLLCVTQGTIRSRLFRARKQLAAAFGVRSGGVAEI
jgi:RNA polymerase sigma-70 factor (ECF subfamily)